jgi:hypothetical protein
MCDSYAWRYVIGIDSVYLIDIQWVFNTFWVYCYLFLVTNSHWVILVVCLLWVFCCLGWECLVVFLECHKTLLILLDHLIVLYSHLRLDLASLFLSFGSYVCLKGCLPFHHGRLILGSLVLRSSIHLWLFVFWSFLFLFLILDDCFLFLDHLFLTLMCVINLLCLCLFHLDLLVLGVYLFLSFVGIVVTFIVAGFVHILFVWWLHFIFHYLFVLFILNFRLFCESWCVFLCLVYLLFVHILFPFIFVVVIILLISVIISIDSFSIVLFLSIVFSIIIFIIVQ